MRRLRNGGDAATVRRRRATRWEVSSSPDTGRVYDARAMTIQRGFGQSTPGENRYAHAHDLMRDTAGAWAVVLRRELDAAPH